MPTGSALGDIPTFELGDPSFKNALHALNDFGAIKIRHVFDVSLIADIQARYDAEIKQARKIFDDVGTPQTQEKLLRALADNGIGKTRQIHDEIFLWLSRGIEQTDLFQQLLRSFFKTDFVIIKNHCTFRWNIPKYFMNKLEFHKDVLLDEVVQKQGSDRPPLTMWISLTDGCGGCAPGLEFLTGLTELDEIPERIRGYSRLNRDDYLQSYETSYQDTIKSIERGFLSRPDIKILRPVLDRGDVMLFKNSMIHRTALDSTMTEERMSLDIRLVPATRSELPIVDPSNRICMR